MVWLPAHCGKFLDNIEGERLFAAFIFTMFSGLRPYYPACGLQDRLDVMRAPDRGTGFDPGTSRHRRADRPEALKFRLLTARDTALISHDYKAVSALTCRFCRALTAGFMPLVS
jgi:hypothetical protein